MPSTMQTLFQNLPAQLAGTRLSTQVSNQVRRWAQPTSSATTAQSVSLLPLLSSSPALHSHPTGLHIAFPLPKLVFFYHVFYFVSVVHLT